MKCSWCGSEIIGKEFWGHKSSVYCVNCKEFMLGVREGYTSQMIIEKSEGITVL